MHRACCRLAGTLGDVRTILGHFSRRPSVSQAAPDTTIDPSGKRTTQIPIEASLIGMRVGLAADGAPGPVPAGATAGWFEAAPANVSQKGLKKTQIS